MNGNLADRPVADILQERGPMNTNHNPYSLYLAAAFAFVFDTQERFLLLRENERERKYMWDLPGGTLTDQEAPEAGLHREVFEETNLRISLVSPLCWLKWDRHRSGRPILVAFYVARTSEPTVILSEEHAGYRWVTKDEFLDEQLRVSAEPEIVASCFAQHESFGGFKSDDGQS